MKGPNLCQGSTTELTAPLEVAAHVNALADRFFERAKMAVEIIDTGAIMDPAIQRNPIAVRRAVLGDDDRKLVAFRHELGPQ